MLLSSSTVFTRWLRWRRCRRRRRRHHRLLLFGRDEEEEYLTPCTKGTEPNSYSVSTPPCLLPVSSDNDNSVDAQFAFFSFLPLGFREIVFLVVVDVRLLQPGHPAGPPTPSVFLLSSSSSFPLPFLMIQSRSRFCFVIGVVWQSMTVDTGRLRRMSHATQLCRRRTRNIVEWGEQDEKGDTNPKCIWSSYSFTFFLSAVFFSLLLPLVRIFPLRAIHDKLTRTSD